MDTTTGTRGIEIDFLAVGDESKSGDAICFRYGNLQGPREEQIVVTIDGGTVESGERLVKHIKEVYGTDYVNAAILSHPDNDHASGMRKVVEQLTVGAVLMHRPWEHSNEIHEWVVDGRATPNSLRQRTKENFAAAYEVEKIAGQRGFPVLEPFTGLPLNAELIVLGPSLSFYQNALASFNCMPETVPPPERSLFGKIAEAIKKIYESWDKDALVEPAADASSPENNSSLVLLLNLGTH